MSLGYYENWKNEENVFQRSISDVKRVPRLFSHINDHTTLSNGKAKWWQLYIELSRYGDRGRIVISENPVKTRRRE